MAETLTRLFVEPPLAAGAAVPLNPDQAHYLQRVMRLPAGAELLAFNGRDGEWLCRLGPGSGRHAALTALRRTRPQQAPPDLWLLFAPIRKARTDFIVEKATELGVARLLPVQTRHTNAERVNLERLRAHAREAAEQCEGLSVPPVAELAPLERVLADWPPDRRLAFCDEALAGEALAGEAAAPGLQGAPRGPWALLIGPEGGFAETERARLLALPQVHRLGLGPRILRADTAAVAAITCWQLALGDWQQPEGRETPDRTAPPGAPATSRGPAAPADPASRPDAGAPRPPDAAPGHTAPAPAAPARPGRPRR